MGMRSKTENGTVATDGNGSEISGFHRKVVILLPHSDAVRHRQIAIRFVAQRLSLFRPRWVLLLGIALVPSILVLASFFYLVALILHVGPSLTWLIKVLVWTGYICGVALGVLNIIIATLRSRIVKRRLHRQWKRQNLIVPDDKSSHKDKAPCRQAAERGAIRIETVQMKPVTQMLVHYLMSDLLINLCLLAVFLFGLPIAMIVRAPGGSGVTTGVFMFLVFSLPLAIAWRLFGFVLLVRRFQDASTRNRCVQCGYDLHGLPNHHQELFPRCPECGLGFVAPEA